ncbi:DEAD/DEAH box helicase family protein [Geobacter pelophilus]|uniref:DEAD/DEAH box helicase family protein n=1 Tax=Geoanaerobacter pelophilus TaxID=60036 RepID=A0AAW4L6K3_9BACT|nr:type I restriction-modification enzyme R subunit C-terminal domain-containing protein [Geoanaerobacter pelophilus]MBT0663654.1 DEAD/DEAH box helicase family protein [Geoanaerobacter pelophilus]
MPPTPEEKAREEIDRLLIQAGWLVCDLKEANIHAGRGVAIREFPLKPGHGEADYLLYVDGQAAGVVEAKPAGYTLTGVEIQSDKYKHGLPDTLPAWSRPLPFCYQSTGVETRFTNELDPNPRSRPVFSFHRPETLAAWLTDEGDREIGIASEPSSIYRSTYRARLRQMPTLHEEGLWPAQITAIANLEKSLADNRPRSLVQMATGSGKTFTAVSFIYRQLKFANAKRVLFLVDRANLGRQTFKEFQQYDSPVNTFKFTDEYIVQHLQGTTIDTTARVCICTIQRLYSILRGEELPEELDEQSAEGVESLFKEPQPVVYNPAVPPETFDLIITDECHRSIYNLWRQVLEYFDSFLVGLTATPSKQTFGFFNQNLVMEYPHEQAVADGVNVNYDVYRIRTRITQGGSTVEAGHYVDRRERETRAVRWERLDEDLAYEAKQLDRDVVAVDQIRTVIKTFRDKVLTEIFPQRQWVPKTLIFAKDDSHAEDIVKIVREEFGKGNDFCQKITYRTTGAKPEDLIAAFRTSPMPRIAVTVDMIATGTDIKPLEIVFFMRTVKSRSFFEQMKGRGVRVINKDDLLAVTPDAIAKDHFVIVDAVGVCEEDKTDSRPLEKKPTVSLEKLLQAVALGNAESETISSLAGRFARLEKKLPPEATAEIAKLAGKGLKEITADLIAAIDPEQQIEQARRQFATDDPTVEQVKQAATQLVREAVKPLCNPRVREKILELHARADQLIDTVSADEVIEAGFDAEALEKAKGLVQSFEQFIEEHKDEITALQILYSRPYHQRLRYDEIKSLAEMIEKPPYLWRIDRLWDAYAALETSRVKGAGTRRLWTDIVSLVRFALHQDPVLEPFAEHVHERFAVWLAKQEEGGMTFSDEQRRWLEMIRDHVVANLSIERDDFAYVPFSQEGGIGKVYQLFGEELWPMLEELNEVLAA